MKAKVILSMVLLTFSAYSCILEEGYKPEKRTQAAKLIWDATSNVVSGNLYAADLALKLDLWMTAPESQKNQIEDRYFPGSKIRVTQGVWNLTGTPVFIYPDDKSIHTVGSVWKVLFADPLYTYPPTRRMHITIECTGDMEWQIATYDGEAVNDEFEFEMGLSGRRVESPANAAGYIYTVSGGGTYIPFEYSYMDESLILSYQVSSELTFHPQSIQSLYNNYFYRAYQGKCSITVNDKKNSAVDDKILVEILSGSSTRIVYKLTYNGTTENWESSTL